MSKEDMLHNLLTYTNNTQNPLGGGMFSYNISNLIPIVSR